MYMLPDCQKGKEISDRIGVRKGGKRRLRQLSRPGKKRPWNRAMMSGLHGASGDIAERAAHSLVGKTNSVPRGGCVRWMEKLAPPPRISSSSVSVVESSAILSLLAPFRFLVLLAALFRAGFDSAAVTTALAAEDDEVGGGGGVRPLVFCCDDRSETAGETEGP